MSLGSWEPAADAAARHIRIEPKTLQHLICLSRDERLGDLESELPADERQALSGLMSIDHNEWQSAAADLTNDDLLHLIRLSEETSTDWLNYIIFDTSLSCNPDSTYITKCTSNTSTYDDEI